MNRLAAASAQWSRLLALGALAVALPTAACNGAGQPARERDRSGGELRIETLARGLEVPWEIAFLPDGRALVTERPGRVRLLGEDGRLRAEPLATIHVRAVGEGGLLGLAVDPAFEHNGFVYIYRTTATGNEVVRYRLDGDRLAQEAVVVDGIPAGAVHDGGRIHFGPDEALYIATGDAGNPELAPQRSSLGGKFLRVPPGEYRGEGASPDVLSLGHRNPQGFDWQPGSGRLVATEHGDSANDEVNVIESGANYGWPEAEGTRHGSFRAPITVYADTTIAPSGATFVSDEGSRWSGSFLIAGLRSSSCGGSRSRATRSPPTT